jgi:ribose transport system substrate-binding protein
MTCKQMLARAAGTVFAAAATVALVACGSDGSPADGAAKEGKAGGKKVVVAHFLASNSTHQQEYQRGGDAAAKALENVTVRNFVAGPDTDPTKAAKQVQQIEAAAATGQYDAFLIEPADGAAVVPAIKQAAAHGIAVVCGFGVCGPDQSRFGKQMKEVATQMGIDGGKIGDQAAPIIHEACEAKDPCNLVIMAGIPGFPAEDLELERLKSGLRQFSDVKLVATGVGRYTASVSFKAMQDIVQAHPRIDVVYAPGDQMIVGSEQALDKTELKGKVALIGSGASALATTAIRENRWYASAVFRPFHSGYVGVEYAVKAARGEQVPELVDSEASPLAPSGFVTPENAGKWKPEWAG